MFSGRFPLHSNAEGVYFIDRNGTHFGHILDFLRDPARLALIPAMLDDMQKAELAAEVSFYSLQVEVDRRMMPCYVQEQQERIGVSLLGRACVTGTTEALQAAVAQARALVVEMGSTTPWLTEEFQDVRYAITERVVNGAPVWAAANGKWFMHRSVNTRRNNSRQFMITDKANLGSNRGYIYHTQVNVDHPAPTMMPASGWVSGWYVTLAPQYALAPRWPDQTCQWVAVPNMRVTAVHGLPDNEPTMAAALRQLAALSAYTRTQLRRAHAPPPQQ